MDVFPEDFGSATDVIFAPGHLEDSPSLPLSADELTEAFDLLATGELIGLVDEVVGRDGE